MRASSIFSLLSSSGLVASIPMTTFDGYSLPSVYPRGLETHAGQAVKKWAAMGDSYASGIGAGVRGSNNGDTTCSRYTESYPNVMNVVLDGTGPINRQFQDNACSGAVSTVVKDTQANAFDKDIDIATLTVGGNDIGFANLINNCIFQFYITKSCQDQINEAAANIASPDFHTNLDKLTFEILQNAGAPQFKLYWTGYAHFWNQDTTQCDDVTWSYWTRDNPPKLTQDLRKQLNDLTTQLNGAVKDAVDRANSNDPRKPVVYVDYSNSFNTHRYCEDGVTEPDPNRADTWFFEWDTTEAYTVTESHDFPDGSLEKQIQDWIDQQAAADGSLKPASQGSHWIADSLAKIFHPRIDGHNAIKDAVLASYAANPPSNPWGNYVPGWCGIHVVQYQKNEASGPNAGSPNYLLDVNIYDARQNLINADPPGSGSGVRFVALTNVPQTVDSALPLGLNITVGAVDDDAVLFQYGDQSWGSNDQAHHSNFGSYDGGSRNGDTGFSC